MLTPRARASIRTCIDFIGHGARPLRLAVQLLVVLLVASSCDRQLTDPLALRPAPPQGLVVPAKGSFEVISAGYTHTCGLRSDGTAECWGANGEGQAPGVTVASSGSFTTVGAGFYSNCAVRTDGVVECWGQPGAAWSPAVRTATAGGRFARVAVGFHHSCGLRTDGAVECWGTNEYGSSPGMKVPATGVFTSVSTGDYHGCALRSDGAAECWGDNFYGQAPATRTATAGSYVHVSARGDHTCGVRSDGIAECWGKNLSGESPATRPPVSGGFAQVGSGNAHTCALRTDGVVECWGSNGDGQGPATRAAAVGVYTQVTSGIWHTCALRSDGIVECWGSGAGASSPTRSAPAPMGGGYREIESGYEHTCALRPDSAIECWGFNNLGQAGAPRVASNGGRFVHVTAGYYYTCGLRADGSIECWGQNVYGEAEPMRRAATGTFVEVSGGGAHTCALRVDGVIQCWGYNQDGRAPATRTALTGRFTQVSAGAFHVCALRDDGVVECWGRDDFAEAPPTRTASGGMTFTHISSGEAHTCAIRTDGAAECWGWNDDAQSPPLRLASAGGRLTQVAAGARHTCALRSDGDVECWGTNANGEGPPSRASSNGLPFTQVTVGASHSCALRTDGVTECWGYPDSRTPSTKSPGSDPGRVMPIATLQVPSSAASGTPFTASLVAAQVPGYPSATAFEYDFDCGTGEGYGARSDTPMVSCTAGAMGSQTVRARVYDQDGDNSEYRATVTIAAPPCRAAPSGVVALWRANGDGADAVGTSTATPQNGASFGGGYVNQAFAFDGVNDWAVVGNPAILKLKKAFTIEAWVRPTYVVASGQQEYRVIASKWGQSTALDSYWFALHMTGGVIRLTSVVNQAPSTGGTVYLSANGGIVPADEWSHVAATFDAVSGMLQLYVNGVATASATRAAPIFTSDVGVVIGGEAVGPTFRPFPGLIDELTVFNRALSAQEVADVAGTGPSGVCDPPPAPTGPSDQEITFTSAAPVPAYVGTTYSVAATATSGIDVTFSSLTSSTCSVTGSSVVFTAQGTCTVAADQAGNGTSWSAAPRITQTIAVNRRLQTIGGLTLPGAPFVGTAVTPNVESTSGLAVVVSSLTPSVCSVQGTSTVTFAAEGTCTVAADQAGDGTYQSAPRVTVTSTVVRRPQAITFTSTAPVPGMVDGTYVVSASGGASGNPVVITSLTPGICKITVAKGSTKVAFQAPGVCSVAADQAGSATYLPAATQVQVIAVRWPFNGYFAPLVNYPQENVIKAGAKVGVSFSLGGDRGLDIFASYAPPIARTYTCGGNPLDQSNSTVVPVTATLSYSATSGAYTYLWTTSKASAGTCVILNLTFVGGNGRGIIFRFQ